MASYAEVMKVLAELYRAGEDAVRGPLRGRIQNLQKLGVPLHGQVGKGKKLDYQRQQIYQLVFCMELAEIGLNPSQVASTVRVLWELAFGGAFLAEAAVPSLDNDRILILVADQMSTAWTTPQSPSPFCTVMPMTVKQSDEKTLAEDIAGLKRDKRWRHLSMINVSEIVREVEPRLADILSPPQRVPDGLHKKAHSA
jgi:hypothetical protein